MWNVVSDFLLKAHASGLGHDAVIEIMIALLGIMIAVLTLIAALVATAIGFIGFFGFQIIRDEAIERAAENALDVAAKTAESRMDLFIREQQAAGLASSQRTSRLRKSARGKTETPVSIQASQAVVQPERSKAKNDRNLKRGGK